MAASPACLIDALCGWRAFMEWLISLVMGALVGGTIGAVAGALLYGLAGGIVGFLVCGTLGVFAGGFAASIVERSSSAWDWSCGTCCGVFCGAARCINATVSECAGIMAAARDYICSCNFPACCTDTCGECCQCCHEWCGSCISESQTVQEIKVAKKAASKRNRRQLRTPAIATKATSSKSPNVLPPSTQDALQLGAHVKLSAAGVADIARSLATPPLRPYHTHIGHLAEGDVGMVTMVVHGSYRQYQVRPIDNTKGVSPQA